MVLSLVLLIIVLMIILKIIFRRFLKKSGATSTTTYSWLDIINPLNMEPFRLYKHLSPENKSSFWSLTSSFLVAIITFWAGLTLPLYINDKGQQATDRLARYQIIDRFYTMYSEYVDSCSEILNLLNYSMVEVKEDKNDKALKAIYSYISNNENRSMIAKTAEMSVEFSSKIIPYVTRMELADSIRKNNYYLFLGYKCLSDSTIEIADSSAFVKNLTMECSSLYNKIGYNSNVKRIASMFYSLVKFNQSLGVKGKDAMEAKIISQLILTPMIKNKQFIENEFFFPDGNVTKESVLTDVRVKALLLLLLCVFVGYMLFRIVLMRALDKKSLTPNPLLSQSDLDKLKKEIKELKMELSLREKD